MIKQNVSEFGNVGDYIANPREVIPHGRIFVPGKAALKSYAMPEQGKYSRKYVSGVEENVPRLFEGGKIDPRLGLGYMITSEGIVNVCLWGGEYPSLMTPQVFTFEARSKSPKFQRGNLETVGAYCAWEQAIAGFEAEAWRGYLASPQTDSDKFVYLDSFFSGLLNNPPRKESIHELSKLSIRAIRGLERVGVTTLSQVSNVRADQLLGLKNFGRSTLEEVRTALSIRGLYLAGEGPDRQ